MDISEGNHDRCPDGARKIAQLLALALALAPLALFIHLGSHSRLWFDDFCHLTAGLEWGPWKNVLFWRNLISGSYSWYFLHGLVAPLDTAAPAVFVVIVVAGWLGGLVWLIDAGRRLFGLEEPPPAQTFILAAALAALTFDGLLTPKSLYWFSASARHTLSSAIMVIALAAGCEFACRSPTPRTDSLRRLAFACAPFALVAFVNAGLAESAAVLQLMLFATLLPAVFTILPARARRRFCALLLSALVGNGAALLTILTAPGAARRLAMSEEWLNLPTRSPTELSLAIIDHLLSFLTHAGLHAAFMGMFALSLFLCLGRVARRHTQTPSISQPLQLAAPPLLLCMLAQLALVPLVWAQQSDSPLLFGRFSPSYMIVIVANGTLLLTLAMVLAARKHINTVLRRQPGYWAAIPALMLAVIFLVFCLASFRSVDWRAKIHVYSSVYTLLLGLYWQFHSRLPASLRLGFLAAGLSAILTLGLPVLALVGVNEFIFGYVHHYSLPFVPFAFAFAGYIGGSALAFGIKHVNAARPAGQSTRAIMAGSALVTVAIWFGMMQRNAQAIPSFEEYARAWDERHHLVLAHRERGEWLAALPRLDATNSPALGFRGGGSVDYWLSNCASDEITALLEKRYRA